MDGLPVNFESTSDLPVIVSSRCRHDAGAAAGLTQPIASIAFYAAAALNWFGRDEPNIKETIFALNRIIDCAKRASDFVALQRCENTQECSS
jgi:hypothetical protein